MADNGERPGILTLPDLNGKIDTGEIETVLAVLPNPAGRLTGRHFPALHFLEQVAKTGFELPAGTFALPAPALRCRPELDTLCAVPWLERTAIALCTPFADGSPFPSAPRVMLQQQLNRVAEKGVSVRVAATIQYYLFQESYPALAGRDYTRPVPLGETGQTADSQAASLAEPLHAALRRQLTAAGVPVAHTQRETAAGQYRLSLYTADTLQALDGLMLVRHALPALARQMGLAATFMAQPLATSPGSALSLSLSFWDPAGKRPWPAGEEEAAATYSYFRAGLQTHLPDWLLFFASGVNSFKRWRLAGMETMLEREPAGGQTRSPVVETTLPGADANPYLAGAAMLAAGLAGLEVEQVPPEETSFWPLSLPEAAERLVDSETGQDIFGEDTLHFYADMAIAESTAFDQAITTWEHARYFI